MDSTYTKLNYSYSDDEGGDRALNPRSRLSFGLDDESDSAAIPLAFEKVPAFTDIVVEAIRTNGEKRGTSLQFIKAFIKDKYSVSDVVMKRRLKPAIEKCLDQNRIVRPKPKTGAKEPSGISGRYKLAAEARKPVAKKIKTAAKASRSSHKSNDEKEEQTKAKSTQAKSLTVKLAQSKVKQARLSLAASKEKTLPKTKVAKKDKVSGAIGKFPVLNAAAEPMKGAKSLRTDKKAKAGTSSDKTTKSPRKSRKEKTIKEKPKKKVVKRKAENARDKKTTKAEKRGLATNKMSKPTKSKSATNDTEKSKKK